MDDGLTEDRKRKIEAEELYRSRVKDRMSHDFQKPRQSGCANPLLIIAGFVILLVAVSSVINPEEQLEKSNGTQQSASFITPTQNTTGRGIGVSRNAVIQGLKPHGFSFNEDGISASQGKTEFVGLRGKNKFAKVLLAGPEDNLTQASIWVDAIGKHKGTELVKETLSKPLSDKDKEELNTGLLKVPIFVGIIDETAVTWIESQMTNAGDNPLSFDMSKPNSRTAKVFGDNLFEFIYFPVGLVVNVVSTP